MRCVLLAIPLCLAAGCSNEPAQAPVEADSSDDATKVRAAARAEPVDQQPPAPNNGRASIFTALVDENCGPERVIEETGDWDRTCRGTGGYTLEWGSGDLREDLAVIAGKSRTDLGIPVKVANGAFDAIGKTIEWRGPEGGRPDVLVARVHVANDQGEIDGGHLAIVRLGDAPCIVVVVSPQQGQSEKARAIADGKLPACLKA